MSSTYTEKPIRVGIIGVGRGQNFADGATELVGMKLVALCDTWEEKLHAVGTRYGVTTYTDYDRFLEHEMDAVILANYFHEHAPFAIKALRAGKHVMSECACNTTLAEGVALCRAVEQTGLVYMIAENYPFTRFNMEMRRLYHTGEIGRVTYAEGEYNHPMDTESAYRISPGGKHWRNWIPSTYYCTHALAPLMYITDTMPVSINGLAIAVPEVTDSLFRYNDPGSVILCRMDNGAVFRLFGLWLPGHSNWYRVHRDVRRHGNRPRPRLFWSRAGARSGMMNGTARMVRLPNVPTYPNGRNTPTWQPKPGMVAVTFGPIFRSPMPSAAVNRPTWMSTVVWR